MRCRDGLDKSWCARSGVMLPNSDSVAKPRATLARLVESAERVIKLGKTIIDAGVAVKMVEQKQRDVERDMTYAIMVGIEALGLGENDKGCALAAMRTWMIREMEAKQVDGHTASTGALSVG